MLLNYPRVDNQKKKKRKKVSLKKKQDAFQVSPNLLGNESIPRSSSILNISRRSKRKFSKMMKNKTTVDQELQISFKLANQEMQGTHPQKRAPLSGPPCYQHAGGRHLHDHGKKDFTDGRGRYVHSQDKVQFQKMPI